MTHGPDLKVAFDTIVIDVFFRKTQYFVTGPHESFVDRASACDHVTCPLLLISCSPGNDSQKSIGLAVCFDSLPSDRNAHGVGKHILGVVLVCLNIRKAHGIQHIPDIVGIPVVIGLVFGIVSSNTGFGRLK